MSSDQDSPVGWSDGSGDEDKFVINERVLRVCEVACVQVFIL